MSSAPWSSLDTLTEPLADADFFCYVDVDADGGPQNKTIEAQQILAYIEANLDNLSNDLNMGKNSIVDVSGILVKGESDDTPEYFSISDRTAMDGQIISQFTFQGTTDMSSDVTYSEIKAIAENTTEPTNLLDGKLLFNVLDSSGLNSYISLNDGGDEDIKFFRDLNMVQNSIEEVLDLKFNTGSSITSTGGDIELNVNVNNFIELIFSSSINFAFSDTHLRFINNGTHIRNLDFLADLSANKILEFDFSEGNPDVFATIAYAAVGSPAIISCEGSASDEDLLIEPKGDGSLQLNSLATQELGFFGETPVVQQSSTGHTGGFTAGSGTGVNVDSTFTGGLGNNAYTIGDIVRHLKRYGLLAQS